MKTQSVVISVRFLSTIGHLISVLLLFSLYEANVAVSLSDTASSVDIQHAKQQALSALVIAMLCFCVDFSGMFFGTSLFNNSVSILCILCLYFLTFLSLTILLNVILAQYAANSSPFRW